LTYSQLLRLIDKGESQTLDFKRKITHPKKIAKTLVSFANTKGGKLLIGVDDDKRIIGVDPDEEKYIVNEALLQYCLPTFELDYLAVEDTYGNYVLIVNIPESQNKPHFVAGNDQSKKAYVRMNDKSILASNMLLKNMQKGVVENTATKNLSKVQQVLFEYLAIHEKITVKEYAKLCNLSERRAKRTLIEQTLNGFLFSHDFNKEVFYSLTNH